MRYSMLHLSKEHDRYLSEFIILVIKFIYLLFHHYIKCNKLLLTLQLKRIYNLIEIINDNDFHFRVVQLIINLFLWGRGKIMQRRISLYIIIFAIAIIAFPFRSFAASAEDDLQDANKNIIEAIQSVQSGDMQGAKKQYETFSSTWMSIESGIKEQSQ